MASVYIITIANPDLYFNDCHRCSWCNDHRYDHYHCGSYNRNTCRNCYHYRRYQHHCRRYHHHCRRRSCGCHNRLWAVFSCLTLGILRIVLASAAPDHCVPLRCYLCGYFSISYPKNQSKWKTAAEITDWMILGMVWGRKKLNHHPKEWLQ